jgi:hypothetical protein
MRPTVIRLIAGGALGIAFSVSLMLPGAVILPEQAQIRHLASPDRPAATVVRAAPVQRPSTAAAPRHVVVRPVFVPRVRTDPVTNVVRQTPRRSSSSPKPVKRTSPPAQTLTSLAATPAAESERKPKKDKSAKRERKPEKARKQKRSKERGGEREEKSDDRGKKDKGRGDDQGDEGDQGDHGDHGDHGDEGDRGEGDDSVDG